MKRLFAPLLVGSVFLLWGAYGVAGQDGRTDLAAWIEMVNVNQGALYIVDVRPKADYLAGTVPGAIAAGADPSGFLADGRGGPALIVAAPDASTDFLAAWRDRLALFGFSPIHVVEGGFPAWAAAGGPVEQPADVFVKPGTTPFIIPRGICEMNTPAQVYE